MRCFFTCFGFSKTKKRRKSAYRVPRVDQIHGNYEPLDSNPKNDLKSGSKSEFSGSKGKETSSIGVKKKVSFNLNVTSYEPLQQSKLTSYSSESEDENYEENKEETVKTKVSVSEFLETGTFPVNHRYQNWQENDDEMTLEDSDVDEEISEEYDEGKNGISLVREMNKFGSDSKAKRDRSEYVFNVLNPVENLAQWKAIKAKTPTRLKQYRKENTRSDFDYEANIRQIKPLIGDMAVNTSLSSWLASTK